MSSESKRPASETGPTQFEIGRGGARYLFTMLRLSDGTGDRITTGELHESLDVTPASVTEMVSKLDTQGLVDYEKYRGVKLTDRGESFATRMAWRFCIVSTFFDSVLGTGLSEPVAFKIAFTLPQDGLFELRKLTDTPCLSLCPEPTGELDHCAC